MQVEVQRYMQKVRAPANLIWRNTRLMCAQFRRHKGLVSSRIEASILIIV